MLFSNTIKESCKEYCNTVDFSEDFTEEDKKLFKLYLAFKFTKDLEDEEFNDNDKKIFKTLKTYKAFIDKEEYNRIRDEQAFVINLNT